MTALQGFRIVELAERVTGEYCGKLLSDFGAEVIKVERPGTGSPTRAMAPIVGEGPNGENSGLFAYLNTNKQSVTLDLADSEDLASLRRLIATADVVIDDHDGPWLKAIGLSPEAFERDYPSVLLCAITPYGYGAGDETQLAKSLNVFHRGGWGYHTPAVDDPAQPPLKGPGRFLADYEGALDAAIAITASLYWRQQSGQGQFVDVSELGALISRADIVLGRMMAGVDEASTSRLCYSQGGPHAFFPCQDGIVYLYMTSRKHWLGLRALLGEPEWACRYDEDWLEFAATPEAIDQFRARFGEWVRPMKKHEVSAEAQRLGLPLVAVNDASDLHQSEQFAFRGFFQPLQHPVLGETLYPTVPYVMSASPAKLSAPAPALGAHNLAEIQARPRAPRPHTDALPKRQAPNGSRGGPLAGVRVLEITKVWAGPYAGKLLAFLGAEVIKVESKTNLDEMRAYGGVDIDHAPYFLSLNPEVLSVQVNLKLEEGREQLRRLVSQSDIVINNLRPGAFERLGLGFDEMRAIKPDIISVSVKMHGNDGPLGYQTGYAPCFAALGGLNYLVGNEGEAPTGINMRYGDSTVGANAAFAALVALLHRERTGEGQFVDVSAVECMSSMVGDRLFEYGLTKEVPGPDGNFHPDMAPHGCYACRDGAWISIAVDTDEGWRALCGVLGRDDLAKDQAYATLAGRQSHRKAMDQAISEATANCDANDLAGRLRAAGVAACKSQTSLDLISDTFFWERDMYKFVSNAKEGSRPVVGVPWHMSRSSTTISRGAPKLGEDNAYVYGEVLGLSEDELAQLVRDGVVN